MAQFQTVQINFTGGIVSPGDLKEILEVAAASKVAQVRFGLRQQLILDVPTKHFTVFEKGCLNKCIIFYKRKENVPNIVSSYPATDIFTTDTWLREGVYKDVFDLFDYHPALKINICDSTQSLVPFFTGHINWISSASAHFWHLYIRFPKTQTLYRFPELIYTNDIATLSKRIEQLLLEEPGHTSGDQLYQQLKAMAYISKPIEKELSLPQFALPYYEGFNKYEAHYWLGIYRRNEIFPLSFLMDVCSVCTETKVGQLYTTPWKSLVIKGIEASHRQLWDFVLGKYRVNVRHAANELNWQVEDNNEEGLQLKRHIIRHFDKEDVRTYGLCFAVQTQPHSGMFGSVIIKKEVVKNPGRLKALDRYEIRYCKGFTPNAFETLLFRQHVAKEYLGPYLVSLCKFFYEQQRNQLDSIISASAPNAETPKENKTRIVHQCRHCYTIYDVVLGDTENGIAPGTPFDQLPGSFCCSLCDAGKADFVTVEENRLHLQRM
jgi:rubredoxin